MAGTVRAIEMREIWPFLLAWQMGRNLRGRPLLTVGIVASILIFVIHPSLGLILLLLIHAWRCHCALLRYILEKTMYLCASIELWVMGVADAPIGFVFLSFFWHMVIFWNYGMISHQQQKKLPWKKNENGFIKHSDNAFPQDELPSLAKPSALSFAETQLEIFYHHQGVLLLHLITTVMLIPSLVAFVQVQQLSTLFPLSSIGYPGVSVFSSDISINAKVCTICRE